MSQKVWLNSGSTIAGHRIRQYRQLANTGNNVAISVVSLGHRHTHTRYATLIALLLAYAILFASILLFFFSITHDRLLGKGKGSWALPTASPSL